MKEITREDDMEGNEPHFLPSFVDKNGKGYVKIAKKSSKPFNNQNRTSKTKKISINNPWLKRKEWMELVKSLGRLMVTPYLPSTLQSHTCIINLIN